MALVAIAAAGYAVVAGLAWWRPRVLRAASPVGVALAAAAAIVGSLLADGAATESSGYDAVLRVVAGLAFVVVGCCTTARPRLAGALVLGIAAVAGSGGAWPAMLGLGASLALVLARSDGPTVGAWVGLALGQGALRLDWPEFTGGPALVATGAFVVLAVSAMAHVRPRTRRRTAMVVAVVAFVVLAIGAVWAVAAWSVRDDLNRAVEVARSGLDAARSGDTALAEAHFDEAEALFAHAQRRLGSWWARSVAALPVAAQNADALRAMTGAGRELAAAGAKTAQEADPDAIKPTDGRVPLDEVRALAAPLDDATAALEHARGVLAELRSPWLAGILTNKARDLDRKLVRALRDAASARLAVEVVPGLLGGDGERRYLLVFQTPAEQRANGGVIGNVAELTYRDGVIALERNLRDTEVNEGNPGVPRTLVGPEEYVRRYGMYTPELVIQNLTLSPDFPTVAEVLEGVYPQSGGGEIDGVISIDPIALAEFLRLTGDVAVPGTDVVLTPDNAADILLREQYERFPGLDERAAFLQSAVRAVFDQLTTTELPGPSRIGEVLGPVVRQGRLQLHSREPEEQRFFRRIGAERAFPPVAGDFVGVVTQNAGGNKLDVFQQRALRYDARVDPATGNVEATATIRLRNDAPASGLPDYVIGSAPPGRLPAGTSRMMVSVYSPLELRSATIDGREAPFLADRELDRNVYTAQVDLPPGGRAEVELRLAGAVELRGPGRRYRLDVWHQATVAPDRVRVRVAVPPGWTVHPVTGVEARGEGAVGVGRLTEDLTVRARFTGS